MGANLYYILDSIYPSTFVPIILGPPKSFLRLSQTAQPSKRHVELMFPI